MSGAPKKVKSAEAKTAQTGMYEKLDADTYVTPRKMDQSEPDQPEVYSPVSSVEVSEPTKDEIEIGSRQEKFTKAIMTATGRKRKAKKSVRKTPKGKKSVRKTRKGKKSRKH